MSVSDVAALVSALLLGLSAGLFFAFTVAVMPGLLTVGDTAFVATMNSINRAILNPVFFLVFVGAFVAPVVTTILAWGTPTGWFAVGASVVYLIGVLAVTGRVNVPLNDALAKDNDRQAYEPRWVRWNTVRSVSSAGAFVLALVALAV